MMKRISQKTLDDLEFSAILKQVADHAESPMAKIAIYDKKPIACKETLLETLQSTWEYHSSFESEQVFPTVIASDTTPVLKLLSIENSTLTCENFVAIAKNDRQF